MDFLYIQTIDSLLRLDMKKKFNPYLSGESPPKPELMVSFIDPASASSYATARSAPAAALYGILPMAPSAPGDSTAPSASGVSYSTDSSKILPSGMCVIKLGSRIFFIGGERSRLAYEYDPHENSFKEARTLNFLYYKDCPVIEKVGQKIYALQSDFDFNLEVLDTSINDGHDGGWVAYLNSPKSSRMNYFVLRDRFYISTEKSGLLYFDETRGTWEEDLDMYGVPLPRLGKSFDEDIVIGVRNLDLDSFCTRHSLCAYLYSEDGLLVARQDLGDVFDGIVGDSCHFFLTDDGRICALAFGAHGTRCFSKESLPYETLVVSIISVRRLPLADRLLNLHRADPPTVTFLPAFENEEFLSSNIHQQHFFSFEEEFEEICPPYVQGAFFV